MSKYLGVNVKGPVAEWVNYQLISPVMDLVNGRQIFDQVQVGSQVIDSV